MHVSNYLNADFDYLPFDGDERFIFRRRLYFINGIILERFHNGSIVDVYMNRMK